MSLKATHNNSLNYNYVFRLINQFIFASKSRYTAQVRANSINKVKKKS